MPLANLLQEPRKRWPEKVAIWHTDRPWKYRELDYAADCVAGALAEAGVRPGDRVALLTPNCIELVQSYLGIFKLGAIAVPLNDRYQTEEIQYGIEHCGATTLIVHEELLPRAVALPLAQLGISRSYVIGDAASPPFRRFNELFCESTSTLLITTTAENEPAAILYTSGSTARPKGVTHTYGGLWQTALIQSKSFEFTAEDVHLIATAACHIGAFAGQLLPALYTGGTCVLTHVPQPEEFVAAIEKHQVTRTQLLPAGLEDVVEHLERQPPRKLQSWRGCTVGGDAVAPELHQRFRAVTGFDVTELYGQTEAVSTFTNPPFGPKRPGSFGKPVAHTSGRIVDADGRDLPDGDVGELLVKTPAKLQGYWNDPTATAAAIRDGWLYTGDLARRDADGFYWFAGRKKEIIIRAGSNISPMEVERVIDAHPAVHLSGVVGKPDAHYGQIVVAYVQLRPDAAGQPSAAELRTFIGERIAAYKVPEEIHFVDQMPLNSTGKVDRRELHTAVQQATSAG